jgi:hypothetical protein
VDRTGSGRPREPSGPEGFYLIMGHLAHNRSPRDDDEDDRNWLVFQGIRVIARDDVVIIGDEGLATPANRGYTPWHPTLP